MIKRFAAAVLSTALFFSSSFGAFAASSSTADPASPISAQTWRYLDQNPAGENSITAYSLGGRPAKEDALAQLSAILRQNGNFTAAQLGGGIVAMVKLGENPFSYKKNNLLPTLYSFSDLSRNGLNDVSLALTAYEAAASVKDGGEIPDAAPNSAASLMDYIVSSQQRSGGFSLTPGHDPDVSATARAVIALSGKSDRPYVATALDKALAWLSDVQNSDGSFSAKGKPSGSATALTLTALRMCGVAQQDERFLKNGSSVSDALLRFRNVDGGYMSANGEYSDVFTTELAVIALYTDQSGLSPFFAPACYPGYTPPAESDVQLYLRFLGGFIVMLVIIYALLLLTAKIGKKWSGKPLPPIPDPYAPDPPKAKYDSSTAHTIEIHIPMNAALPDFDNIQEHAQPEKKQP